MARKRGNNEGTIYKRKDGRWCAQVSLSGRRITKYAKTQKECRDWVKQISNKIEHGLTFDGTQLSLERFMESWLAGKDLSLRPNTVRNYRRYSEQAYPARAWKNAAPDHPPCAHPSALPADAGGR